MIPSYLRRELTSFLNDITKGAILSLKFSLLSGFKSHFKSRFGQTNDESLDFILPKCPKEHRTKMATSKMKNGPQLSLFIFLRLGNAILESRRKKVNFSVCYGNGITHYM